MIFSGKNYYPYENVAIITISHVTTKYFIKKMHQLASYKSHINYMLQFI